MKTSFLRILFVAFIASMLSALPAVAENEQTTKVVTKGVADSVALQRASIYFADEVLLHDMDLSITSIDSTAVPELDYGMFNVSVEGEGFRFLPHGTHFGGDGATVKLRYDRTRIPSGYTEDDIRTYYYDTDKKNWVALQLVEVDKQQACVISRTTHFTDMINGVIVAPESPETSAFTPTMMNDIKAADPTSKINIITPPTANNRGSANLQYPFEMPPARNGMQPHVALSYNSDGGSGWAGEGWDISIPSITVDTRWGVPRYNTTYETETYLLNGQMLAMMNGNEMTVAHRTDSVLRQENRQFFMRQGGDFNLIIREGDNINNYYWVVTDRNGVKYTYGGDANARLSGTYTDVNGNQRQVIAEWKLTRIEEPHGDYIEYVYNNIDEDTISSNLRTKAVYLSQINAGNAGSLPHTKVTFKNLNAKKTIKINNARYGFLTSSSQLLDSVLVEFKSSGSYEKLRSYKLEYEDGPFYKRLLSRVSHRDNFGNEVSYQEFDYYNDVSISNQNITQFEDDFETIDIGGNSSNNFLQYLTDTPTALGGTATTSWGLSFYAGVGVIDGSQWKGNTVGASYSYSHDTSEGQTAFIDLNGDGLPDKVYVQNDSIYYCPQYISSNNNQSFFDNPVRVNGIYSISKTTSKTHTYSIVPKHVLGWMDLTGEYSRENAKTKTVSTEYFNDINGDGLVDFVSKGKVYFNHLDNNGVPTFTLSSGDTPSPIIYGREIDTSLYNPDMEEQHVLLQNSPMIDVVRVWQSPRDGDITISGFVQRILPQSEYDEDDYSKADMLRVSIEKNGVEWWSQIIEKGDTTKFYPSSNAYHVNKNDNIFFRVQCGTDSLSNGAFDNVRWSPIITFAESETNPLTYTLPNGYSSNEFIPEEGAIYDVNTFIRIENGSQFNLSSKFIKPVTTDNIILRIIGKDDKYDSSGNENSNYREAVVFERTFNSTTAADSLQINSTILNHQQFKNFYFEVTSESNVDWSKVKWFPSVTYIDNNADTIKIDIPAHYKLYANCLNEGIPFWCSASDSIWVIRPSVFFNDHTLTGQLTVTVKSRYSLVAKHTYNIENGAIVSDGDITFVPTSNRLLWVECFYDGFVNDNSFINASYRIFKRAPQNADLQVVSFSPAYFYAMQKDQGFGLMYRGWGGFAYNAANGRYAHPIDVSLLSLPQDTTERINPLTMPFNQLGTDQGSLNKWVGQNGNIYLTAYEAGAARLTEQDVKMTNPLINEFEIASESGTTLTGTGAKAINQISNSSSTIDQEGFLSLLTLNQAEGAAETKQTMMDLNGDGFPDILSYGTVQYTNSHGGLSGEIINIELEKSNNSSSFSGIGGIPVGSVSNIIELIKNGNVALQNAQTEWGAQMSVNGGENRNYDEAVVQFIDVNGDGLPDKVTSLNDSSNKFVCLNMGYSFTSPVSWNMETIQKGSSVTGNGNVSGGAGGGILGVTNNNTTNTQINKASGSFSVGIGFSDSWSYESYRLLDVNGDGLPDKIKTTGNDFTSNDSVALNLGDRFDNFVLLNGINAISASSSSAASANAAFTVTINIPVANIKICANPGASLGYSVNRPFYSLQDVDSDGFIDVVTSSNENELKVKHSTIARTNKLRTVTNSLGGKFTLDYKHNTPTYGLPGGKWVMSSVEIDYGIHGDYEIPNTKNVFEYNNGRRDRHEREFLGFGQVITKNIDTQNDMALYRQTIEEYDTGSIYSAGNLLHSYITKPTGNKLTEIENQYYSYGLTNTAASGVNGGKYKFNANFSLWNDRGAAYCPLRYTKNTQYENGNNAIMSESWNSYFTGQGDHGLLSNYRYSDKGSLDSLGTGNYDYQTAIDYNTKLSGSNYYFGQPNQVVVTDSNGLFHLVQATYSSAYPTQLTSVKRAVKPKEFDPDTPVTPLGGDGLNIGMRPGQDPLTFDPDTHGYNIYTRDLDFAETSYSYDAHGNLTKVIFPEGSDRTRVYYEYIYEDTLSTYIREVDDIFGLNSIDMSHDFRYGITNLTIDQNGARYLVTNDNVGRMSAVRSPNELDADNMTMLFEYNPIAIVDNGVIIKPASATTTYYFRRKYRNNINEETDVKSMKITTFVDGFGRVIETRKESNIKND